MSASAISVDGGEPRLDVYLDFSRWDHCLNEPLFYVTSSDAIPIPPGTLTIEPNFSSASLVATLRGIDQITGVVAAAGGSTWWWSPVPRPRVAGATRSVVNGVLFKAHESYAYRTSQVAGSVSTPAGNLIGGYPVGAADFVEASFGNQRSQARTAP